MFAGDIARFVALCVDAGSQSAEGSKSGEAAGRGDGLGDVQGKIFEAGGPDGVLYSPQ